MKIIATIVILVALGLAHAMGRELERARVRRLLP